MNHYSPLRYPGGKNSIFKFISSILKENHLLGIDYAEPYAGGAGLALRLLVEGFVSRILINDLDFSIYSFWKTVLERNSEFCAWVGKVDLSVPNWKKFKKIYENHADGDHFELAKATFFLNRTNVSGVIKGGLIGGVTQEGNYKIDARFNRSELIERIKLVGQLKDRIQLSNKDGLDFLRGVVRRGAETFIYLDPPYVKKGSHLYMNYFTEKDHRKLSVFVKKLKSRFIVSYDRSDLILDLYKEKRKVIYNLQQSTSNKIGDEILIFSDNVSPENSLEFISNPIPDFELRLTGT